MAEPDSNSPDGGTSVVDAAHPRIVKITNRKIRSNSRREIYELDEDGRGSSAGSSVSLTPTEETTQSSSDSSSCSSCGSSAHASPRVSTRNGRNVIVFERTNCDGTVTLRFSFPPNTTTGEKSYLPGTPPSKKPSPK